MKVNYLSPKVCPEIAYDYYASKIRKDRSTNARWDKYFETGIYTIDMTAEKLCKAFKYSRIITSK